MTQTEARELANQFGTRMCDENGETHGEELYCFDLDDIIALKEALAQPEQEPVAYLCEPDENGLYGLPLTEKTCTKCFPVYRHPQRTWVGLTDDEIKTMDAGLTSNASFYAGALWAEAKLKQKNGYAEEKNT
jgi:hypothetical protein